MIVTMTNGQVHEMDPIAECTGYRAKKIEMEVQDFKRLHHLSESDPQRFGQVMTQLGGRLVSLDTASKIDRANEALKNLAHDLQENPYQTLIDFEEPVRELARWLEMDHRVDEAIGRAREKTAGESLAGLAMDDDMIPMPINSGRGKDIGIPSQG